MAQTHEPLTSERLAEIERRLMQPYNAFDGAFDSQEEQTIYDLIQEVRYLQGRNGFLEGYRKEIESDNERLRTQVDRQAASFVEQRGKLYETMAEVDRLQAALAEAEGGFRIVTGMYDALEERMNAALAAAEAREAALVEVVRAVAAAGMKRSPVDGVWLQFNHAPNIKEQARALLAASEAGKGTRESDENTVIF